MLIVYHITRGTYFQLHRYQPDYILYRGTLLHIWLQVYGLHIYEGMLAWAIVPGFVDLCTSLPISRGNLSWDRHSVMSRCYWHCIHIIPLCPANSCIPVRRTTECTVCPFFERTCVTFSGTEQLTQLFESNCSCWAEESCCSSYQHDSWDTSHRCVA